MIKNLFISALFLVSYASSASAAIDDEGEKQSLVLQIAKRVALTYNTQELPSRGYQLSSLAVKKSKKLQAVQLQDPKSISSTAPVKQ